MFKEAWKNEAYRRLKTIRQRCSREGFLYYKSYGGRGIRCLIEVDEWFDFYKRTYPGQGWTVGRIDHSRHYSLDNIEWQLQSEQTRERNKRHGLPKYDKRISLIITFADGSEIEVASGQEAATLLKVPRAEISLMLANKYKKPKTYQVRRAKDGIKHTRSPGAT